MCASIRVQINKNIPSSGLPLNFPLAVGVSFVFE